METELEQILTSYNKARMISYMNSHPEAFVECIHLALADKKPYSWRAAWLLWSCMEEDDSRIRDYVHKMVDVLPGKEDNQKRELLIILRKMDLNDAVEGELYDACIAIWEQIHKSPSLRISAFKLLSKVAEKHPELDGELVFLTQPQYLETLSPAGKRAIIKMLRSNNESLKDKRSAHI
jgi:hypothetical protein